MRSRRTARVLLFDPAERVLLIRFVVPRDEGSLSSGPHPEARSKATRVRRRQQCARFARSLGLT